MSATFFNYCTTIGQQLGLSKCVEAPGPPRYLELVPATHQFDTPAKAADIEEHKTLLNAIPSLRGYLTPLIENIENANEETVRQTFNSGRTSKIRDGIPGINGIFVEIANCNVAALRALANKGYSAYVHTENSYIQGTHDVENPDETTPVKPIPLNLFDIGGSTFATDDAIPELPVSIQFASALYTTDKRVYVKRDWGVPELAIFSPKSVKVTVSEALTSGITFDVAFSCGGGTTPVTGLSVENFVLLDSTGANVPIDAATETPAGSGTYIATHATAFPTGDFTLAVSPSAIGATIGYETPFAATLTIA